MKSKLNLIIDALLLLCLAAIAGIGLLINYVLVPGSQRWEIYGRNVDLFFWGMDRHEWGAIHYVLAQILLSLLVPHLVLHWKIIVGLCRKLIPNRAARGMAAVVLAGLTVLFLGFWVFVSPDVRDRAQGEGYGGHRRQMTRDPLPEESGLNKCKENDHGERTDETAIVGSGRRYGRSRGRQCGDGCRRWQEVQAQ